LRRGLGEGACGGEDYEQGTHEGIVSESARPG
jgi:hypothetical protein